jgi:lipopolysaccharide heptosyltransferase I
MEFQRILIIKPSSLGDVATALPMLCDLRRAYPNARIDWLVAPMFAALVQGHDAINDVILFDRKELGKWWRSPSAFAKFGALKRRLKDGRYDCVIDAQGLLRSGYLSWVTGAKVRVGFADAREGGSFFYTHKVAIQRKEAMAVVRMRALLGAIGVSHTGTVEYRVPIKKAAAEKVAELVPEGSIGFIPGSRGEGKRWPAEGFSRVISALNEKHPVALFGSPDERNLCEAILKEAGNGICPRMNLAGQTSIAEMSAGLARCQLIIGNDTGPLHVAVALGRPILGLYGKTDPASVGPYGQLQNVIRFKPDGSGWEDVATHVIARAKESLTGAATCEA